MRYYLFFLCVLPGLISCNSHDRFYQGILDDLQGSYTIDSVVYITQSGQDSVLLNAGTFHMNPCEADDNFSSKICDGYYETTAGDRTDFGFQLVEEEQFTLTPDSEDLPAGFNIRIGTVNFNQDDEKLLLTFYKPENYELYLEEGKPQRLVLTKQ